MDGIRFGWANRGQLPIVTPQKCPSFNLFVFTKQAKQSLTKLPGFNEIHCIGGTKLCLVSRLDCLIDKIQMLSIFCQEVE